MRYSIAVAALLLAVSTSYGQGIIIRPDFQPAEVVLESHKIDASIQENVAVVTVQHVFRNPGSVQAEGSFLFPLPPDAHVSKFSMEVDGKELAGQLLTADQARQIYENIVRRSLDPALLELVGHRSFRASVFPIPPGGRRTITLRYDAELPRHANTISFLYPMRGSVSTNPTIRGAIDDGTLRSIGETSVRVEMTTASPLVNVYSPSHKVDIQRPNDRRAVVRYESDRAERDFVLYFGTDRSEVGATLLSHRPYGDKPGYFMLLVSPRVDLGNERVQPKDVVFVLDTSGSMAGEKIEQAQEAVRYCLNRLGEGDRFGLVTFSTDVEPFRPELMPASARGDAVYFVDQLEASGGTNIHAALIAATKMISDSERGMIVFITDGLPSAGIQDEGAIRKDVAKVLDGKARVFSFGVGYDVNTMLLDGLSHDTGAPAGYISPEENIEERISAFYDRVRHPLLTDLTFELEGAEAYAFAPRHLTDLYKGGQLIIAGRYRRPGDSRLILRGRRNGQAESFTYTVDFPERERGKDFVARLWATRRVGQLLDEIRMNGENAEMKNEVIALAKEFGLVTPYTSYLVQEEEILAQDVMLRPETGGRRDLLMSAGADAFLSRAASGAPAVAASKAIQEMAEADQISSPTHLTSINGRTLRFDGRAWQDVEFSGEPVKIKMGSDAYFALLRRYPEALEFAMLGPEVTFLLEGKYVRIGDEGIASDEEFDRVSSEW